MKLLDDRYLYKIIIIVIFALLITNISYANIKVVQNTNSVYNSDHRGQLYDHKRKTQDGTLSDRIKISGNDMDIIYITNNEKFCENLMFLFNQHFNLTKFKTKYKTIIKNNINSNDIQWTSGSYIANIFMNVYSYQDVYASWVHICDINIKIFDKAGQIHLDKSCYLKWENHNEDDLYYRNDWEDKFYLVKKLMNEFVRTHSENFVIEKTDDKYIYVRNTKGISGKHFSNHFNGAYADTYKGVARIYKYMADSTNNEMLDVESKQLKLKQITPDWLIFYKENINDNYTIRIY